MPIKFKRDDIVHILSALEDGKEIKLSDGSPVSKSIFFEQSNLTAFFQCCASSSDIPKKSHPDDLFIPLNFSNMSKIYKKYPDIIFSVFSLDSKTFEKGLKIKNLFATAATTLASRFNGYYELIQHYHTHENAENIKMASLRNKNILDLYYLTKSEEQLNQVVNSLFTNLGITPSENIRKNMKHYITNNPASYESLQEKILEYLVFQNENSIRLNDSPWNTDDFVKMRKDFRRSSINKPLIQKIKSANDTFINQTREIIKNKYVNKLNEFYDNYRPEENIESNNSHNGRILNEVVNSLFEKYGISISDEVRKDFKYFIIKNKFSYQVLQENIFDFLFLIENKLNNDIPWNKQSLIDIRNEFRELHENKSQIEKINKANPKSIAQLKKEVASQYINNFDINSFNKTEIIANMVPGAMAMINNGRVIDHDEVITISNFLYIDHRNIFSDQRFLNALVNFYPDCIDDILKSLSRIHSLQENNSDKRITPHYIKKQFDIIRNEARAKAQGKKNYYLENISLDLSSQLQMQQQQQQQQQQQITGIKPPVFNGKLYEGDLNFQIFGDKFPYKVSEAANESLIRKISMFSMGLNEFNLPTGFCLKSMDDELILDLDDKNESKISKNPLTQILDSDKKAEQPAPEVKSAPGARNLKPVEIIVERGSLKQFVGYNKKQDKTVSDFIKENSGNDNLVAEFIALENPTYSKEFLSSLSRQQKEILTRHKDLLVDLVCTHGAQSVGYILSAFAKLDPTKSEVLEKIIFKLNINSYELMHRKNTQAIQTLSSFSEIDRHWFFLLLNQIKSPSPAELTDLCDAFVYFKKQYQDITSQNLPKDCLLINVSNMEVSLDRYLALLRAGYPPNDNSNLDLTVNAFRSQLEKLNQKNIESKAEQSREIEYQAENKVAEVEVSEQNKWDFIDGAGIKNIYKINNLAHDGQAAINKLYKTQTDKLINNYNKVVKTGRLLDTEDITQLKQEAAELIQLMRDPNAENNTEENKLKLIAYLIQIKYLLSGKKEFAYDTQVLALINETVCNAGDSFAQIQTGQGKTLIASMMAVMLYAQGGSVEICTSDGALANAAADECNNFYQAVGIPTGDPITANSNPEDYKNDGIYYSDVSNLALYKQKCTATNADVPEKISGIIDEVDFLAKSQMVYRYAVQSNVSNVFKEKIYYLINEFIDSKLEYIYSRDKTINELRLFIKNNRQTGFTTEEIDSITDIQLDKWLAAAVNAKSVFTHTKEQWLKDINQPKQKNSPLGLTEDLYSIARIIVNNNFSEHVELKYGGQQFLHARLNTDPEFSQKIIDKTLPEFIVKPENRVVSEMQAIDLMKSYQKNGGFLKGMTATLGEEKSRKKLLKQFNAPKLTEYPAHQDRISLDLTVPVENEAELFATMARQIRGYKSSNKPVLIICDNEKDAAKFFQYLQTVEPNIGEMQKFTASHQKESVKETVRRACLPGMITVTDSLGRGTDFKAEGLCTLIDGIDDAETIKQKRGRSARQELTGETIHYVRLDQLVKSESVSLHGKIGDTRSAMTKKISKSIALERAKSAILGYFLKSIFTQNDVPQSLTMAGDFTEYLNNLWSNLIEKKYESVQVINSKVRAEIIKESIENIIEYSKNPAMGLLIEGTSQSHIDNIFPKTNYEKLSRYGDLIPKEMEKIEIQDHNIALNKQLSLYKDKIQSIDINQITISEMDSYLKLLNDIYIGVVQTTSLNNKPVGVGRSDDLVKLAMIDKLRAALVIIKQPSNEIRNAFSNLNSIIQKDPLKAEDIQSYSTQFDRLGISTYVLSNIISQLKKEEGRFETFIPVSDWNLIQQAQTIAKKLKNKPQYKSTKIEEYLNEFYKTSGANYYQFTTACLLIKMAELIEQKKDDKRYYIIASHLFEKLNKQPKNSSLTNQIIKNFIGYYNDAVNRDTNDDLMKFIENATIAIDSNKFIPQIKSDNVVDNLFETIQSMDSSTNISFFSSLKKNSDKTGKVHGNSKIYDSVINAYKMLYLASNEEDIRVAKKFVYNERDAINIIRNDLKNNIPISEEMANIIKHATVETSSAKIKNNIDNRIDHALITYINDIDGFKQFAMRSSVPEQILQEKTIDECAKITKQYLYQSMSERLMKVRQYSKEIELSLCFEYKKPKSGILYTRSEFIVKDPVKLKRFIQENPNYSLGAQHVFRFEDNGKIMELSSYQNNQLENFLYQERINVQIDENSMSLYGLIKEDFKNPAMDINARLKNYIVRLTFIQNIMMDKDIFKSNPYQSKINELIDLIGGHNQDAAPFYLIQLCDEAYTVINRTFETLDSTNNNLDELYVKIKIYEKLNGSSYIKAIKSAVLALETEAPNVIYNTGLKNILLEKQKTLNTIVDRISQLDNELVDAETIQQIKESFERIDAVLKPTHETQSKQQYFTSVHELQKNGNSSFLDQGADYFQTPRNEAINNVRATAEPIITNIVTQDTAIILNNPTAKNYKAGAVMIKQGGDIKIFDFENPEISFSSLLAKLLLNTVERNDHSPFTQEDLSRYIKEKYINVLQNTKNPQLISKENLNNILLDLFRKNDETYKLKIPPFNFFKTSNVDLAAYIYDKFEAQVKSHRQDLLSWAMIWMSTLEAQGKQAKDMYIEGSSGNTEFARLFLILVCAKGEGLSNLASANQTGYKFDITENDISLMREVIKTKDTSADKINQLAGQRELNQLLIQINGHLTQPVDNDLKSLEEMKKQYVRDQSLLKNLDSQGKYVQLYGDLPLKLILKIEEIDKKLDQLRNNSALSVGGRNVI